MKARRLPRLGRRLVEPFPLVAGNRFATAERSDAYFGRMLGAINEARASVDVEMYLWVDDEVGQSFVAALHAAVTRGVRVRVLVDAVGSSDVVDALRVVDEAGGDVRVFSPFRIRFLSRWFHRTHKKLLLCDGELAYTGGAGFSRYWSGGSRSELPWHDRMFELRGPVVRQLVTVFESDFHRWRASRERAATEPVRLSPDLSPAGSADLQVLRGWPDSRDFSAALLREIRAAKERIWIGTPYFIPPPSLLRALTAALRRGVDVRLVLPSGNYAHPLVWHASRRHYAWFLKRGAKIHEFANAFYHAKLAVIDRSVAIVGSSNLDYWSWSRNAEMDLVASDAPSVELMAGCFEADVARSREVRLSDIGMRSFWHRVKNHVAGWVERWL